MNDGLKVALGAVSGAVAFVLISFAEGARGSALLNYSPGFALAVVTGVIASVALAAAVITLGARFGIGAIISMAAFLLLGLVTGNIMESATNGIVLPLPDLFGRGAGSITAWSTLAVTGLLVVRSRLQHRDHASENVKTGKATSRV